MPIVSRNYEPPSGSKVLDREGELSGAYRVYFTAIGNQLEKKLGADVETTVPLIAAGATTQATATVPGLKASDFCLGATFVPGDAGIRVTGQVTADETVIVTFENLTGAGITPGAGKLYLRLEGRA